jgi:hypothetical protein
MPTKIIFLIAILILYLLFFFGIIGPKRWRNFVKGFYTWFDKNRREVIFPIDPNKPIVQATKEGLKEVPNRIKWLGWLPWNWSPIKGSYVVFIILQIIIIGIIAFIFLKY